MSPDMNLETLAVIIALMMNLAGLVWGAAKFTSSVSRLENDVVPRLLEMLENLSKIVQRHDKDIAVLQALRRRSTNALSGS